MDLVNFPLQPKILSRMISSGYITDEIRDILAKELLTLRVRNPNSWDRQFVESLITRKKPLSEKQKDQLHRVLQNYTAYPKMFDHIFNP